MRRRLSVLAGLSLALVAPLACRDHSTDPRTRPPAAAAISAGDTQTGTVASRLPTQLTVVVRDAQGQPIGGVAVAWSVTGSTGSVDPAQTITDGLGQASAFWMLGTGAGVQHARATVSGLPAVEFSATANPGLPKIVQVTPDSVVLDAVGDTARLTAVVSDTFQNAISGVVVTWRSSDTTIAVINTDGRLTSRTEGTVQVTATVGTAVGTSRVRVAQLLASLALARDTATLTAIGDTIRLKANGRDKNGALLPNIPVTYASLDSLIAQTDSLGKVTARTNGVARIVATSRGKADTATVTVSQVPVSLRITPAPVTINAIGDTIALTAAMTDRNGFALSSVSSLTWSTSSPAVTVDSTGHVISRAQGVAFVRATRNGMTDSVSVTVRQVIATVAVSAPTPTMAAGSAVVFPVVARDSNGVAVAGTAFTWTSSDATIAAVDNTGRVQVALVGTAQITASTGAGASAISGVASVQVIPGAPATITIVSGNGQGAIALNPVADSLVVKVVDAFGNLAVGATVQWATTAGGGTPSPATSIVGADGLARTRYTLGGAAGTNTVTATVGTIAPATFNAEATVPVGPAGGSVRTPGDSVVITVPAGAVAGNVALTISPIANPLADPGFVPGTSFEFGPTGTVFSTPVQIVMHFDPAQIPAGTPPSELKLHAFVGGVWQEVVPSSVDLVNNTVTASLDHFSIYAILRERAAHIITAAPDTMTLASIGANQPIVVTLFDIHNFVLNPRLFTYTSANTAVATVNSSGVVTAAGSGTTKVTVAFGPLSDTVVVKVLQVPATVAVTPASTTLNAIGATQQLTAVVKDANGIVMPSATVTWGTSNAAVATVSPTGLVTAVANGGPITITATSGTASGTASITVTQVATTIAISAGNAQTAIVNTAVAVAPAVLVSDANGHPVAGVSVTFAATVGNGTIVGGAPAVTGTNGIAAVTSWTLGTTAGAQSITATSTGLTGSPITFNATATAGAADGPHSSIAALPVSITANGTATATVTITLRDVNNNPLTASGGTVAVSRTGTGTLSAVSDNNNGTYTATLTAPATVGQAVVSAAINTVAVAGSATVDFVPGLVHHFLVEAAGGGAIGTKAAGTPFNVQITAQDANNNTVTGFTGTVDVTSNRTGTAGLTQSASFTAGVLASHGVTLTTPTGAGATITATNHGSTETGTSAAFTLNSGGVTHFIVEAAGGGAIGTQSAGTPFNVQFTAQDAFNNTATGFTGTVDVTSNRTGTSGLTQSAAFTAGVLSSHSVTLTTPTGSGATVTATNHGSTEAGTSAAFTLNPGGVNHFVVEAAGGGAIGTQAAGAPFNVQFTAQDAFNNTATGFTGTVDVTSNRTGTAGLTQSASFIAGVLASHSVTLTTPTGSGATITATNHGSTETGTSAAFTLNPGGVTHFLVEAAGGGAIGTQTAGAPFNIRITAQDASNNTDTGFTGTVIVSSNRTGTSGLTTTASFVGGVLASHSVTLTTPSGSGATITATNSAPSAEAGTSNSFTLNPGGVTHFLVEATGGGAIGTQTAGTPFNVQFTAQDAFNNTATGFTGTVDVTSNRTGTSGLTQSATFTAGVLTSHSVTLTTPRGAGATITATNHGSTEAGTSAAFTLNSGLVTHFKVEATGGGAIGTQTAGTPFNVQFTAQDAFNNTATGFTGTVDVTSNRTGTSGLTQSATFIAGVLTSHSVTLTTPTGAGATITATNHGSTETGTSAAFTLNPGGVTHFLVEAAGGGAIATQAAGTPFNIKITALDASNNTDTGFTGTVNVTSNRTGTSGLTQSATFIAGVLTSHSVTLTTPSGAGATITATNHAGTETGTSAAFTLNPGLVTHFVVEAAGGGALGTQTAGTPFNVQFTAQDAFNNTATGFTGTVDVTSNRTGTSGLTQSASFVAGVLTSHSVTLTTPRGAGATITATNHGSTEAGTSAAFTLNSGLVTHFKVEATGGGAIGTQTAGTPFNVQFTAQDAFNNTATGFTGTVDVTSNRTGTSGLTQSATFIAGVLTSHSVTLTTPTGAGATITATNHGSTETGTSAAFTLNPGGVDHFLVEAAGGGNIGTQTAGAAFNVQITAQDASNNTVTSFTGVGKTVDITSNRTGSSGLTTTATFTNGVLASHSITLTQSGANSTITATRTGGTETGTSNTFTVNPGALNTFTVRAVGGAAISTQTAGQAFTTDITAKDAFGNTVTSFVGTVDVTSNRTGTAGLTQSAPFTGGLLSGHSITLTTPTGAGATVTATNHGSTEAGTSNAFTLDAGPVDHFVVEAAGGGNIPAQTAGTSFNVQITAKDVGGNTAVSFTGTVDVTSNRTGSSGLTQSASFTGGVLASHSITLTTPTGSGATITATLHNAASPTGTSNAFALNAGALHHFLVEAAGGGPIATQTAGVAFNVQFTAQDVANNTVTSFTGAGHTVDVTSNRTGTSGLTQSATFTAGVLASHSVTLTTPTGAGATITATNHGSTEAGTSAAFALNVGALHHFSVEAQGGGAVGAHAAGVPFNVQFTAQDAGNNTVTSFTGTVDVSSNRTASAGTSPPPSAAFTAGVLASHSITLTQSGGGATITATRSGGTETGTSNTFTIGTPPTVTTTTPADLAVSVSRAATITVNFSAAVTATASAFTIECPVGSTQPYSMTGSGSASITLTPTSQLPAGQNCRVTVNATQIADASTTAPMQSNYVFTFETVPSTGTDTYPQTVIGNMSVQSANVGVPYSATANETSAESFTITSFDAVSAHGGDVSMTTSGPNIGQFTYNPPAGYHGPNDTFTYTITTSGGSTAIGTVTMPISGMVWYIDTNAGSNGDGRLSNPFNNLASFNTINNGTGNHPAANDNIFLYESGTAYVGPVTLLSGQKLIGQDAAASLTTITGLTPPSSSASFPSMNAANATHVAITSAGNGVNISSGSNTLRGFRLGGDGGVGSLSGIAISGTSTGTLTVANVAITQGASGGAISIGSAATMTASIVLDSVRSSGGTNAVSFTNVNGSATLQNVGTTPSNLSGASGATVFVSGGNLSLTIPAPVSQANNAAMVNVAGGHTGTINFNNTLTATNGTGLQFNNADGTYNFNSAVAVGTSASQALNINNGSSGVFNLTVGSTAFTNQTGNAVVISNSAPTVDYRGTITKSSVGNGLISITGLTAPGTVTFSGVLSQTTSPTPAIAAISDSSNTGGTVNFSGTSKTLTVGSGGGVSLRNNAGSTINFTNGGLLINNAGATGFNVSGGGTVTVGGSGNTIGTTSGIALNVQNTTSNGLTFQSITSAGAANGIVMISTGAGGLTVTGNGGRCDVGDITCTGGAINGATGSDGQVAGNAIYLSNAPNVSLTRMRVAGTVENFGLYGNTVSGLSLNTMLFNGTFGAVTATNEAAVGLDELTGAAAITNSSIFPASGSTGDGLRVLNTTGTALNRLTMTADTIGVTGTNGRNGVYILARGSNTTNVTVQNSTLLGGKLNTFMFTDSVSATSDLVFVNNKVQQTGGAGANGAFQVRMSGATHMTYNIQNNTFTNLQNANQPALEFLSGLNGVGLTGSADGTILANTFGVSGNNTSGSSKTSINLFTRGSGSQRVKVADNSIYGYGGDALAVTAGGDNASLTQPLVNATIVRNTIKNPRPATSSPWVGVYLEAGTGPGHAATLCVNLGESGANDIKDSGSTDYSVPFNILSNTISNGGFLKFLNYSGGPDNGNSGVAEGKLDTQIANANGITALSGLATFGNELIDQANKIGSSTAAVGQTCNLYAP